MKHEIRSRIYKLPRLHAQATVVDLPDHEQIIGCHVEIDAQRGPVLVLWTVRLQAAGRTRDRANT